MSMKNKLFGRGVISTRCDLDNRVLWDKKVSELTAKSDFEYSSVRYKGYLNLDKRMESLSGNLDSGDIVNNPLVDNFLDSSDWDVTEGLSFYKGTGRHVSNELENINVSLDGDIDVLDWDDSSFSYGGYKYNDLFFDMEEDNLDMDEELCTEEDEDLEDFEECEEDLEDEDFEDEEISYILSSVSNYGFVKDVNFLYLENEFNNLSDSNLKSLIRKEKK